jgi:hypothetical protein
VLRPEHHPTLDPVVTLEHSLQNAAPFIGPGLGQEPEAPQVDSQDRHLAAGAKVAGAQHGSIAAQRDEKVEPAPAQLRSQILLLQQATASAGPMGGKELGDLRRQANGLGDLGVGDDGKPARRGRIRSHREDYSGGDVSSPRAWSSRGAQRASD